MKRINFLCLVLLGSLIIPGCSAPVYVQKDDSVNMSNYHTYSWVDTRANEEDKSARATAYADISVRNAVNAELGKMSWREVNEDPDVLLSYDVLVQKTTEQKSDPVYSRPFTRSYYNPYSKRWSNIYYPSQFMGYQNYQVPVKEGTITITMVDARTDKNIWQGWTTDRLNFSRLTDNEISRSVINIFKKFDVASK